jgi:hypothetical protein
MNRFKNVVSLLALLVLYDLIAPRNAHAYLDLGTGSYFLQLTAATIFGGLFTLRVYWANLKSFVRVRILARMKRDSD